jgi:hypothetical protein
MAVSDPQSGLCPGHADAVTINHFLGELYKLQARNKITPRRAAVMAYTANLLLRTLPAIHHEQNDKADENTDPLADFPPHLQEMILYKRKIAAEAYAKRQSAQANSQPVGAAFRGGPSSGQAGENACSGEFTSPALAPSHQAER